MHGTHLLHHCSRTQVGVTSEAELSSDQWYLLSSEKHLWLRMWGGKEIVPSGTGMFWED